jgi:hypothetical protein
LDERLKIAVAIQKLTAVLDAPRCDHRIDGFSDRDAERPEFSEVPRSFDRDFRASEPDESEGREQHVRAFEVGVVPEPLQNLNEDQISDREKFLAEQPVEFVRLRVIAPLK